MGRWTSTGRPTNDTPNPRSDGDRRANCPSPCCCWSKGERLRGPQAGRDAVPQRRHGRFPVLWTPLRRDKRASRASAQPMPRHHQGRQAVPGWSDARVRVLPATPSTTVTKEPVATHLEHAHAHCLAGHSPRRDLRPTVDIDLDPDSLDRRGSVTARLVERTSRCQSPLLTTEVGEGTAVGDELGECRRYGVLVDGRFVAGGGPLEGSRGEESSFPLLPVRIGTGLGGRTWATRQPRAASGATAASLAATILYS